MEGFKRKEPVKPIHTMFIFNDQNKCVIVYKEPMGFGSVTTAEVVRAVKILKHIEPRTYIRWKVRWCITNNSKTNCCCFYSNLKLVIRVILKLMKCFS